MISENDNTYTHPNNLQDSDADNSYESKATDKTNEINTTKNILLYRNGDKFFPPKRFVVNKKYIRTWDSFLEELTKSIQPRNGAIRDIRTPFHGTRIRSLDDLILNGKYVAISKGERMKPIDYASVIDVTSPSYQAKQEKRPLKPLKPINHDLDKVESKINQLYTKGIVIFVYRNGDPFTRGIKIVVGHFEQKHMNTLVRAIEERVLLPSNRPIRRLYTMDGQLIRFAKDVENGQYYVAASNEQFENIKYGQYLPVIRGGKVPSGRQKVKYLNQSPTPAKDSQQSDSNTNGDVTQRSPRSENNTERNKQKPVTSRNQKKQAVKETDIKAIAAIKIQAAFRAYLVRNEVQKAQETNEPITLTRFKYEPKKNKPLQSVNHRNNKPANKPNDKPPNNKETVQKQKDTYNSEDKKRNVKEKASENKHNIKANNKEKSDNHVENSIKKVQAASTIQAAYRGYIVRKQFGQNQTSLPPKSNQNKEGKKEENVHYKENIKAESVKNEESKNKENKKEESKKEESKKEESKNEESKNEESKNEENVQENESKQDDVDENKQSDEEENRNNAAVRIQAGFRGYKTREMLKARTEAAKVIQYAYQGYKARNQIKASQESENREKAASTIQSAFRGYQTRKTINNEQLAEQQASERNIAASKIQAAFRGYKIRTDAPQ